jgi:WD40 repeat protein
LIIGFDNGFIAVWNLNEIKCIKKIDAHEGCVEDMIFIPENKVLTGSDDSSIKLWDLDTGKCLLKIENQTDVHCLALTNDFDLVSGDAEPMIKLWDLQTGEKKALLFGTKPGHNIINSLVVTKNNHLISGDFIGMINVWDLKTLMCIKNIKTQPDYPDLTPGVHYLNDFGSLFTRGISSLMVINDQEFVSCSLDGKRILWDLNSFELKKKFKGHEKSASCVAYYNI